MVWTHFISSSISHLDSSVLHLSRTLVLSLFFPLVGSFQTSFTYHCLPALISPSSTFSIFCPVPTRISSINQYFSPPYQNFLSRHTSQVGLRLNSEDRNIASTNKYPGSAGETSNMSYAPTQKPVMVKSNSAADSQTLRAPVMHRHRKTVSTGGGRAWSDAEVRI